MKWKNVDHRVRILREEGEVCVSFLRCGGVRLSFGKNVEEESPISVLDREPELLPVRVEETAEGLALGAGELKVVFSGDGSFRVEKAGVERFRTPPHAFFAKEEVCGLRFALGKGELVYGLGQDPAARVNHNHQERRMWNQWGGHARSGNNGIGLFASSGGYGMLLTTAADARFCFNESESQPLDPLGEAMVPSQWEKAKPCPAGCGLMEVRGAVDVCLLLGEPGEVLRQYYGLTGFPGLMPKWAYGFLQCKNRYMNREDLLAAARKLRALQIPCDGLVIDWLWFAEFGDLEWREDDWPCPEEMLLELKELGFSVICAQHPFISEQGKYYGQYQKEGYLNQAPDTKRITYDHTNPKARAHWWEKTAKLYRQGVRGYWTDMGELEEHFDGTVSAAGGRSKTHNAYSLLWLKGLYEGQRKEFGTRAFLLSRAACAGIQRYGTAMWSGDINASWQVLGDQVRLAQTMAMSGMPWWGTDIGGFLSGEECTPELYVRWMEWGVFCGLFRTHGTRPGNEADSFGEEACGLIRGLIRLRYMLLPYIYSLAMGCALKGSLLVTPLSCAFPKDPEAAVLEGEYMFGPSLLTAPVTEQGQRSAQVYLPEGTWYHWWSGKKYETGWHTVPAPLGQIPLFVRAGAILPVYAEIGRNVEDCDGLALLDVPGEAGEFDYYDDAGDGFGYETGEYTHVRFVREPQGIRGQVLSGALPEYGIIKFDGNFAAEMFSTRQAEAPGALKGAGRPEIYAAADTSWQGDLAGIRLTFLADGTYRVCLTPEEGWYVTRCTHGGCGYDMEEPAYLPLWQEEIAAKAGETIRWQLCHTQLLRRVGTQNAKISLQRIDGPEKKGGRSQLLTACWDGPFLSAPAMLGCLPKGASAKGFAPQTDPWAFEYLYEGETWRWIKDPLFGHNCFGYVEFRRLNPKREGEKMLGEAWARENLYSKIAQNVDFLLRYDSPITIWLNGAEIYRGDQKNAPEIPVTFRLAKGENTLVIRQIADIPRPYSGGEFGYRLKLAGTHKIYTIK